MLDTVTDIGIQTVTAMLLALAAVGVPWLAAKGGALVGHKLSDANAAKLQGFVRAGIRIAGNDAKRRFRNDYAPLSAGEMEEFAIKKAKAAAKKVGSKLLDKLSENDIVDAVRDQYEEIKAEKANVKNLGGIVEALEAAIKHIDDAPTPHEILTGKVKMKKVDGRWVRDEG